MTRFAWRDETGALYAGTEAEAKKSGHPYWQCFDRAAFIEETREAETALRKVIHSKDGWSECRSLGGSKVVLTEKEKRSIYLQTGLRVDDAQDARRKLKEGGFRFLEKGEETEAVIQAQIDRAESGAKARGEPLPDVLRFPGWHKILGWDQGKPFDHEARLAYYREKFRSQGGSASDE